MRLLRKLMILNIVRSIYRGGGKTIIPQEMQNLSTFNILWLFSDASTTLSRFVILKYVCYVGCSKKEAVCCLIAYSSLKYDI